MTTCPCGGGRPYDNCCGRWHAGAPAPDAEALMRSRYSAFVLGDMGYLLRTWHPETRPTALELDATVTWLGLTVRAVRRSGPDVAEVDFVARSRVGGGSASRQVERSRFRCDDGRWYYLDGVIEAPRRR